MKMESGSAAREQKLVGLFAEQFVERGKKGDLPYNLSQDSIEGILRDIVVEIPSSELQTNLMKNISLHSEYIHLQYKLGLKHTVEETSSIFPFNPYSRGSFASDPINWDSLAQSSILRTIFQNEFIESGASVSPQTVAHCVAWDNNFSSLRVLLSSLSHNKNILDHNLFQSLFPLLCFKLKKLSLLEFSLVVNDLAEILSKFIDLYEGGKQTMLALDQLHALFSTLNYSYILQLRTLALVSSKHESNNALFQILLQSVKRLRPSHYALEFYPLYFCSLVSFLRSMQHDDCFVKRMLMTSSIVVPGKLLGILTTFPAYSTFLADVSLQQTHKLIQLLLELDESDYDTVEEELWRQPLRAEAQKAQYHISTGKEISDEVLFFTDTQGAGSVVDETDGRTEEERDLSQAVGNLIDGMTGGSIEEEEN